jgi:CRP-like cAMP-binding protein
MSLSPDRRLDALDRLLPAPLAAALRPHARIVSRQPGHIIMGYGDRTSDLYLILEGRVQAELHSPSGREVILGDLGPGELLGEFAALDDQPRSATVEAVTACTLACFPGAAFRKAVFAQPETAEWMARQLVGQIRLLTEKLFELNALAVSSRLHCELLRLCIDAGITDNESVIAPVPTHAELAARIGTHREAVTRELQYLAREDIADQAGRKLIVSDVDRLAQFVRAAVGDADLIQRATPAAAPPGAAE